tara:strand:+ start:588 stop:1694 length:1107 start_codon:yes stop_codon:yes gene_type:complete
LTKASNAPSGPIKLTDLADHLGLDKSTVSRALNRRLSVAVETQERILRVARELGYSPNVHGQQLRDWKSTTLNLVLGAGVGGLSSPFYGPFTLHLYRAAADRGHDLLILSDQHHPGDGIADVLLRRGGVGGVLMGQQTNQVLESMSQSVMPCIQLDNYAEGFPSLGFVTSDNQSGARVLTQHLLDLGHHRLSFIGDHESDHYPASPRRMEGLSTLRERYAGFQQALTDAGVSETVAEVNQVTYEEYIRHLLQAPDPPTGIVTVSDSAAADVARIAGELGVNIPGDLCTDRIRRCGSASGRTTRPDDSSRGSGQPGDTRHRGAARIRLQQGGARRDPCSYRTRDPFLRRSSQWPVHGQSQPAITRARSR